MDTYWESILRACRLCPRHCGIDRIAGGRGHCGETAEISLARAALHMWEEPCIAGKRGAGAVFFTGCNLGCIYCQNAGISGGGGGTVVTVERLAEIFLELQEQGAHTLDLVTPTHQVPNVAMALSQAKKQGLHLPVVYNCGGYESPEILKHLEGLVDVWMPDMKYSDPALAARLSGAKDYVEAAKSALEEMVRQQPTPVFNEEGIMEKGVLVRHLVLPGYLKNSRGVLKYLWDTYQSSIWLSLMSQYTPLRAFPGEPSLERSLTKREYEKMVTYALELGFTNAYIQGGEVARESFIPDFDQTGVSEEHRD